MQRRALLAILLLLFAHAALASDSPTENPGPFRHVRLVDFEGEIGAFLAAHVERQMEAAKKAGVDCLVLRIESPGGTVRDSMAIGDRLLALTDDIHVVAWVAKEAYSGAAMVSLACDEIIVGRDAHLGDSQPIVAGPEGVPKPVGEKLESPLRAKFRAYAHRNGYPEALAEAMVSARVEVLKVTDPKGAEHYVRGRDYREAAEDAALIAAWTKKDLTQKGSPVVREGELLTMTAEEARRFGFVGRTFDGDAPYPASEDALLQALAAEGATIEKLELSMTEQASRWLLKIAGVLSAIVALALLVTLFQGIGTITIIGVIALALVLLINATANQLNGFSLFLILVGAILLAAEVFVIPGFGIAGVLGMGAIGAGFLFLATGSNFETPEFGFDEDGRKIAYDFAWQFIITVLAGIGVIAFLSRLFPSFGPARRMVLEAPGGPPVSPEPERIAATTELGAEGVARSDLRPAGNAEIDGRLVDVLTDGAWLPAGTRIRVIQVEGNRVTVRRAGPDAGGTS